MSTIVIKVSAYIGSTDRLPRAIGAWPGRGSPDRDTSCDSNAVAGAHVCAPGAVLGAGGGNVLPA